MLHFWKTNDGSSEPFIWFFFSFNKKLQFDFYMFSVKTKYVRTKWIDMQNILIRELLKPMQKTRS